MTPDNLKRKLTTILSADVKGYSRLMGKDEEWTLNSYKGIIRNLVGEHRGRAISSPGDNVLAEFASVVDAVECAVEIQQVLKAKNAILPETRKMEFRIGINLGDVIEEADSIYGDGVNIAARLEALAEPGGICISGSAYDQIENKIPLHYDYLGEHEVKNITKPVRVYKAQIEPDAVPSPVPEEKKREKKGLSRATLAGIALVVITVVAGLYLFVFRPSAPKIEVASIKKMAFPLPDKPSIAVLPFVNMSGDPKQEFFSDGITEDIITALSKVPELFVIARNSTFTYNDYLIV
jgi:adenylate cyclase